MEYKEILINRITSLCKEKNLSINKLAKMSGLKQSTLDNIVHGNTVYAQGRTIHMIANGFGMTYGEFVSTPEFDNYSFADEEDKE